MGLEGIVIQVIPQKERDLIARVLLREGTAIGVYVYGGMGGGKNSKPRLFEPGNMLRMELRTGKSGYTSSETLQVVAEQTLLWQASHIRHDARGFALACLYLEIILKTALPYAADNAKATQEHGGLFNVLSNGLFHLDQALAKKDLAWEVHLILFMAKFLLHLGILPDENECVFCGCELKDEACAPLVPQQGGFCCSQCITQVEGPLEKESPVRALLAQAVRTHFQDWASFPMVPSAINTQLIQFWCFHFQVKLPDLTSYKMLS